MTRVKRIYTTPPAIAIHMSGDPMDELEDDNIGKYIEGLFESSYMWKSEHDPEVPVVVEGESSTFPVDILYRNKVDRQDTKDLREFIVRFRSNKGFLLTKDYLRPEPFPRKIYVLPAWMFFACME